MQEVSSSPKVKIEIVSGSQVFQFTCVTWGKRHFGNVWPVQMVALVVVTMVTR